MLKSVGSGGCCEGGGGGGDLVEEELSAEPSFLHGYSFNLSLEGGPLNFSFWFNPIQGGGFPHHLLTQPETCWLVFSNNKVDRCPNYNS